MEGGREGSKRIKDKMTENSKLSVTLMETFEIVKFEESHPILSRVMEYKRDGSKVQSNFLSYKYSLV